MPPVPRHRRALLSIRGRRPHRYSYRGAGRPIRRLACVTPMSNGAAGRDGLALLQDQPRHIASSHSVAVSRWPSFSTSRGIPGPATDGASVPSLRIAPMPAAVPPMPAAGIFAERRSCRLAWLGRAHARLCPRPRRRCGVPVVIDVPGPGRFGRGSNRRDKARHAGSVIANSFHS